MVWGASGSHIPLEQRPALSSLLVMMRFKLELKARAHSPDALNFEDRIETPTES